MCRFIRKICEWEDATGNQIVFVLVLAGNDAQAPESMELLPKWSEMKDISEWQSGNPTQSPSLSSFSLWFWVAICVPSKMNKCESNLLSVIVFFLGCKDFQSIAADAIKWFCARFHLIDGHCGCRCHRSRFETISPNMSYTDALLRNSMDVNAIKSININMCALGSRFVYFSLPQQKNRTKNQHPYFVPITWNAHHKYDFYDNILSPSLSLPLSSFRCQS